MHYNGKPINKNYFLNDDRNVEPQPRSVRVAPELINNELLLQLQLPSTFMPGVRGDPYKVEPLQARDRVLEELPQQVLQEYQEHPG